MEPLVITEQWKRKTISHQYSSARNISDVQGKPAMQVTVLNTHAGQESPSMHQEVLLLTPQMKQRALSTVWVGNSHVLVSHKPFKAARHCLGLHYYT